jgi:hypothetical protein
VDTIFVGKDRAYNRRFQQMCGHYLVEPPSIVLEPMANNERPCTPASGWEKGQVENQVGVIRRRLFVPRPRFRNYAELNDEPLARHWSERQWRMLEDRCVAWAKAHPHPELPGRTVWEVFEAERPSLVPYVGPFDGFHAVPASVSKTCLVRFDSEEDQEKVQWIFSPTNRYSVDAKAVGRPVENEPCRAIGPSDNGECLRRARGVLAGRPGRRTAHPRARAEQGCLRPAALYPDPCPQARRPAQ